ncbi:MAG TPA: metallopeptidase TldD-related protein [Thermoleophilaceae bacterium]
MSPLELAQRALGAARAGDGGALVEVTRERSLMLRYARNRPTQSTAIDDVTVEIAVLRGGRVGKASTNATDDDSLARCAGEAEAAAQAMAQSAGDAGYPGFPEPSAVRACDTFDLATASLDATLGGGALAEAFEVAERHGVEAHGTWTVGDVEVAVASSTGVAVSERMTDAFMKVVCIAPSGRSGYATQASNAASALRPRELAERSAAKAAVNGDPVALAPGEYPVVLEPAAVADLLSMLGWQAFNGLAYLEDRSALSGRLGQKLTAPAINLSDSPRFPRTLQRCFDAEGVPKAPLPLIQDGVAVNVVHDTATAARAGTSSTGHATAPGGSTYGPIPCNLVLVGGGAQNAEELCRPIERGIYVTRLWYVNPVRPKETLLTGVTRDGTFLIENGEITRPVVDMRFTDSALGLLERTQALSATPVLTSDGEFYGRRFATGVVCPAVRVGSMRFTG